MKLRCIDHGTRVLAFDGKAFHRTNGERCDGVFGLEIGGKLLGSATSLTVRALTSEMDDPYDFGDGLNFPHECTHFDCGFMCQYKEETDWDHYMRSENYQIDTESAWDMHVRSIPNHMD